MVLHQNNANGIANSEDPDQTAPLGEVLIWVSTVCPDLSVRKLMIITVANTIVFFCLINFQVHFIFSIKT